MAMRRGTVTGAVRDRSVDKVLFEVREQDREYIFQTPQLYGGRYLPEEYGDLVLWAANEAVAAGCVLEEISLEILLPVQEKESVLKKILTRIKHVCLEKQIKVGAVRAETSSAVRRPVCVVTGKGKRYADIFLDVAAGQQLVMSKWLAPQGTAWLAECFCGQLRERLPGWILEEAMDFHRDIDCTGEAQIAMEFGVSTMRAVGEGGVFRACRELGDELGMGLRIDIEKIPVQQETVELTEFFGINPYELCGWGSLLMLTNDGNGLVDALEREGIPAAVIGSATSGQDKVICHGEDTRYLETGIPDSWHSLP